MYPVKNLFPNKKRKPMEQTNKYRHKKQMGICKDCGDEYYYTDKICQVRKDLELCSHCYQIIAARKRYYKKKGEK